MSFYSQIVGNGHGEIPLSKLIEDRRFSLRVEKDLPVYVNGVEKRFPPTERLKCVEEEIRRMLDSERWVMVQADDQAIFISSCFEE